MKTHFPLFAAAVVATAAFTACDVRVNNPPADNTTVVNPPAEKTTIINPPAEKKTETTTTTVGPGTVTEKKTETSQ